MKIAANRCDFSFKGLQQNQKKLYLLVLTKINS